MKTKKLAPEHINTVARCLLQSNAFLAACHHYPFMKGVDFPAFPLTQDRITDFKNPKVSFCKFANDLPLMNQGVLFGFLYVCFVWLREANKGLFDKALTDSDFQREWTPFWKQRKTVWKASLGAPCLNSMMEHFRHAIAHGNVYMNIDEGIRDGQSPHFLLSSYDPRVHDDIAAQFKATFTDLVRFAEATYRAHTAATYNKRYREIDALPVVQRLTSEAVGGIPRA
jgi:hypothetical protein